MAAEIAPSKTSTVIQCTVGWTLRRKEPRRNRQIWVPPAGFEPAPLPPEGSALSPELRGLVPVVRSRRYQPAGRRPDGGPQGAGSGVPPRSASMSVIVVVSAVWVSAIGPARPRDGRARRRARPRTRPSPGRPGGAGSSAAGTRRRTPSPTATRSSASSSSVAMPGISAVRRSIVWPAWPPSSPIQAMALAAGRRQAPQRQPALHPAGLVGLRRGDVEGELPDLGVLAALQREVGHLHALQVVRAMSREKPASTESAVGTAVRRPGRCRGRRPARRRAAPGRRRSPPAGRCGAARGRRARRDAVTAGALRRLPASSWSACRSDRSGALSSPATSGAAEEVGVLAAGADLGVEVGVAGEEVGELLDPLVVGASRPSAGGSTTGG